MTNIFLKMCSNIFVYSVPQGLTKSKRKDFRDRERERLREKEFV